MPPILASRNERVRTLWIDASRGASAAGVLSALLDLGVAPSPILHAVPELGLATDLRVTMCAEGPAIHAEPGAAWLRPRGIDAWIRDAGFPRLASDALRRYALALPKPAADGDACLYAQRAPASDVACVAAAAMALASLEAQRVVISRIGVPDAPDEALLDALAGLEGAMEFGAGDTTLDGACLLRAAADAWGEPEPAWRGPLARGRGCGAGAVQCVLGTLGTR